jgi:glycosyltransferase involved in cell wall biosynthesis
MDKTAVFSIIIPTFNRPQQLAACLEALTRLDYPRNCFEVVVVDDGSPMCLDSIVSSYKEQLTVELIRQDNAGPAAARNRGSSHARGQFLAFTDDDCCPHPNWMQVLERGFEKFPGAILGGDTQNKLKDNVYSEASQLLLSYIYNYYNSSANQAQFFASNNLAIATDQFLSLGGFDTTFPLAAAEDREFCDRCINNRDCLVYLPAARVDHIHKLNPYSFWRQHFNYGRGAYRFHQIRSQRRMEKLRVEPLSFYLQLLIYPFKYRSISEGLILASLFFVSQLANVTGFLREMTLDKGFTTRSIRERVVGTNTKK